MDSESAREFNFEQRLYYPADGSYYEFYPIESPVEWDGQDVYYSAIGSQTECLPYPYVAPGYGYQQSRYNPYNPYIPYAAVGTDGQFIGTHQYFTNPSHELLASSPAYIPAIIQSSPDNFMNSSSAPSIINSVGPQHTPLLTSANVSFTPQNVALGHPILEASKYSLPHIQPSAGVSNGSLVQPEGSKQYLSHGCMTAGSVPFVSQAASSFRNGRISSVPGPLSIPMPANSGFTDSGSSVRGWNAVDKYNPRFQYNRALTDAKRSPNVLGDQNRGPRSKGSTLDATSAFPVQAPANKTGNMNVLGNITIYADEYNRDDFIVDYPVAKFFVIKSYTEDDVHKSIKYNVWSSTPYGNKKLDSAYEDAQRISMGKPRNCPVFLFFSVNTSGRFCGVAEMVGRVDFHKNMDFWHQDKWIGSFPVRWHIIKDVMNTSLRHILLENNEFIPVTSSRDTQEVTYLPGMTMLKIFKDHPLTTYLLHDFMYHEESERIMRERRSRFLGRSQVASLFSPVSVLPSSGLSGANERQLVVRVEDPPKENESQPGLSADRSLESDGQETKGEEAGGPPKDGRKHDGTSVEKLPEAGREHMNGTDQHLEAEGNLLTDENQPEGTDEHDLSHVKRTLACEIAALNISDAKGDVELPTTVDTNGLNHAKMIDSFPHDFIVTVGSMPVDCNGLNYAKTTNSLPEDVIVTVGSMPIKIDYKGESFTGKFTVGSIPVDDKRGA